MFLWESRLAFSESPNARKATKKELVCMSTLRFDGYFPRKLGEFVKS